MAAGYFFTGEQDLTPEGVDRKRALLNALRKDNLSAAPVGHWTQALSRVVGSAADTMEEGQLNRTEKGQTEKAKAELMKVLGLGSAVSPGEPTAAAGASASAPAAAPQGQAAPATGGSSLPIMAQQNPTAALIRSFEGYRDRPYWDVNAHRVGYGSDTVTNPDGSVQRVQPGMQINRQQAELDLQRRISTEFQPRAASAIGENWSKLSPQAQAALTSITYNYGSLPKSVAAAAQTGDPNAIAQAVEGLAGHNGGVNANRRMKEAALIRGADMPAQGAQTAEQALQRPAPGQFTTPGQMPSAGNSPSAAAIMAALGNPWAAKNPALQQVAASVLGKQLGRDPVEDALRRVELQTKMRDLTESKPFEITGPDGEKITVVRDSNGNVRRLQLTGEPAGGQQQKTYKLPDGREVPLPSDPTARKKALEEYGQAGAKSVQNAPQAVQSAAQTISVIDQILGPQNPQTGKFDKPHPGLPWRVGTPFGALPSMYGSDGAGFDALQKQVSGKAFLEAFDSLKGGGAITEVEGNKAQQAIARLDVKQKPEDYMKALQELREIARTGMERAKIIAAGGNPAAAQPPSATGDGWKEISPGIRIREAR